MKRYWSNDTVVSPAEEDGEEIEKMVKKSQSKCMHNIRFCACFLGPVVLVISLCIFQGNIRMSNKLGLQRMRTQRTVKRAMMVQSNCTLDSDSMNPAKSLRLIRRKHRRLKRSSHSRCLSRRLRKIGLELDIFGQDIEAFNDGEASYSCNEWTILNDQANIIVKKYTASIKSFDLEQSILYWFVVVLNTICWLLLAYLVRKHEQASIQKAQTRANEERAAADRLRIDMKARHFLHEIMNHRFGNRIRQARLLFEAQQYDDLEVILRTWEFETDIRMGIFSNLPTGGISAQDLFAQVFTFNHSIQCFCEKTIPLIFVDTQNQPVSYPILQVAFLQDVASNVLKHGGAFARIQIYQDRIIIANDIVKSSNKRPSNRIGLNALMDQSNSFNIPVAFEQDSVEFRSILTIRCKPEQEISLDINDNPQTVSDFDYSKFYWLLVEDSCTIAQLTAKLYKKLGVDLVPLCAASDVFALEGIIAEAAKKSGKPVVVIFDENIYTLNNDLEIVPETGANVRRRLLQNSVCAAMYNKKLLIFASCSASEIYDDQSIICKLGKSTPPCRQLQRLREALTRVQGDQQ